MTARSSAQVKRWSPAAVLVMAIMDPGQLMMERKMFAEIKMRAERLYADHSAAASTPA